MAKAKPAGQATATMITIDAAQTIVEFKQLTAHGSWLNQLRPATTSEKPPPLLELVLGSGRRCRDHVIERVEHDHGQRRP